MYVSNVCIYSYLYDPYLWFGEDEVPVMRLTTRVLTAVPQNATKGNRQVVLATGQPLSSPQKIIKLNPSLC